MASGSDAASSSRTSPRSTGWATSRCTRCAASSLAVEEGEFVAIMGASGSGKSTLMNIIGCLDRPTSGALPARRARTCRASTATRSPRCATGRSASSSRASTCSRAPARSRTSSCRCSTRGRTPASATSARHAALGRVGLADRVHHHPNQLSGGQQQRVAIARALVDQPEGHPRRRADRQPRLARPASRSWRCSRSWRDAGITIVLVTHEPDIAAYASRVVVMRDGKLQVGRPPGAAAGGSARPPRRPREAPS